MKLKSGKAEIVYLLDRVFEKYQQTTGNEIRRNTNRKNYEEVARILSEISNCLPETATELGHIPYAPDRSKKHLSYPNRKYDITGGQVKDASNGMVNNPRSFLIDSCYIYLYGVGRQRFEAEPKDEGLIAEILNSPTDLNDTSLYLLKRIRKWRLAALSSLFIAVVLFIYTCGTYQKLRILDDMKIRPYIPSPAEIKQLEGVWLVYIGSPQARRSDKNRYHLIVTNIVDVHYKNGYFVFKRYGANFNHEGYMQFEQANLVSVRSYVANDKHLIESPRLSLLKLNTSSLLQPVISASWNFDVDKFNDVIGIREVYVKQSNQAATKEILNTIENSACKCKIVEVDDAKGLKKKFFLKNMLLDSLPSPELRSLLDERSILLRHPDSTTIIAH